MTMDASYTVYLPSPSGAAVLAFAAVLCGSRRR